MGICAYDSPIFEHKDYPKNTQFSNNLETAADSPSVLESKLDFSIIPFSLKLFTNSSKLQVPRTELIIRNNEKECIFNKRSITKIFKIVSKEALNGKLSLNQLKRALHDLKLSSTLLQDPDNPTYLFLFSCVSNSLFDLQKIVVAAVLLSDCDIERKIKILFRLFDTKNSRILQSGEINSLVTILFDVSVDNTPILALGEGKNKIMNSEASAYSNFLRAEKDQFIYEFTKSILGPLNDMGRLELLTAIENNRELSLIFSCQTLREVILEKYKNAKNINYMNLF